MQYETIILELLSRIKKLEEDVEALKRAQSTVSSSPVQLQMESPTDSVVQEERSVTYMKLTDEMIDACYCFGKEMLEGKKAKDLADKVAEETGMNHNTAIMHLYAVGSMLEGVIYKRAIGEKAMCRYFDNILSDYGSRALSKALYATRLHIQYRRNHNHKVDSLEQKCNEYERRL